VTGISHTAKPRPAGIHYEAYGGDLTVALMNHQPRITPPI